MREKTYLEQRDEDARAFQSERRARAEAKKSAADKLRDRLKYAANLRANSRAANELAEWLNSWMQGCESGAPVLVRARRTLTVLFGNRTFTLSKKQAQSLFTWSMEHSRAVGANADRIEAELAGGSDE